MSMTDPIADFLTRIRNAIAAQHASCEISGSRMKEQLARLLKQEGYIDDWSAEGEGPTRRIKIQLRYGAGGQNVIHGLERVSKPGRRVYCGVSEIPRVLNGLGVSILSTSRGVVTGDEARRLGAGGEVLCQVW